MLCTLLKYPLQQKKQSQPRHSQDAHGESGEEIHPHRKARQGSGGIDAEEQQKAKERVEKHPPHNAKRRRKHTDQHRRKEHCRACKRCHFPYPTAFTSSKAACAPLSRRASHGASSAFISRMR